MRQGATNALLGSGDDHLPPCGLAGRTAFQDRCMPHRTTNRFNQREVARALKAARLAGERPHRVEIDPKSGKISVILAKSGEATAQANEWDDDGEPQTETR